MKIVYISSSTIPSRAANSIHVMKMCQAFADHGHEVVLLAPDKKDGLEPGVDNVFDYYGVKQNFALDRISCMALKGWGYFYGRQAARSALSYGPDLVFCRNLWGCYFAALAGQDVVFETHAPIIDSGKVQQRFFKKLIRRKELRKLVVITYALKSHYEAYYPELNGKIHVAPDGADPVDEGIEPIHLRNKGKRMQVGYVGHLYAGKGMEVVSQLAKVCNWADFHVVGGTKKDLLYWEEKCSDIVNLNFYGHVLHKEAQRYINALDAVLLPNQKEVRAYGKHGADIGRWTSPLKAFEYMASRKPILASNLPVLREVFTDRVNALLCDPENISEWEQALVKLRDDFSVSCQLAQVAHEDFVSNYTWQARSKQLIEKFTGCLQLQDNQRSSGYTHSKNSRRT